MKSFKKKSQEQGPESGPIHGLLSLLSVFSLLDRSDTRLAIVTLMVTAVTGAALLLPMTEMQANLQDEAARKVAAELAKQPLTSSLILSMMNRFGMVWCYVTDDAGEVITNTRAFKPPIPEIPENSARIKFDKASYYESVQPLQRGYKLHAGFKQHTLKERMDPAQLFVSLANGELPLPWAIVITAIYWLIFSIIASLIVGFSVSRLSKVVEKLAVLASREYSGAELDKATRIPLAPSDFQNLSYQMKVILRIFLNKEEEKKQKEQDMYKWKGKAAVNSVADAADSGAHESIAKPSLESEVYALQVEKQLLEASSTYDFASRLLESMEAIYGDLVAHSVFIRLDKRGNARIESSTGLAQEARDNLERIDLRELTDERNMSKRSIDIGPMLIKRMGFEAFAETNAFSRAIYLPLQRNERALGFIAIFIERGKTVSPERLKGLERFRDKATGIYYDKVIAEESDEDRWSDSITGLFNRSYYQELLPQLLKRAQRGGTFSIIFLEPNFATSELASHPKETHDRWLREASDLLKTKLPPSRRLTPDRGSSAYLLRHHDAVLAAVMEGKDRQAALETGEQLLDALSMNRSWSGGATSIGFAGGVSTYPGDGNNAEALTTAGLKALSFVRERMGQSTVYAADRVPDDYQPKDTTEIAGTLGVLDCAGLLQSIATSQKTGILTVENELGQQFVIAFLEGTPRRAVLGTLRGIDAVIEFITTFKDGKFSFQQQAFTPEELRAAPELQSLEQCLMESALAEDKMIAAMKMVPSPAVLVRRFESPEGWSRAESDSDIEPAEAEMMRRISSMADGNSTLEGIFQNIPSTPVHLKWRGAGLLFSHGLMQFRR